MECANAGAPGAMRGNEALAWGALAAGVRVVTGYPGSPATGVFDALVARTSPDEVDASWAPNEKVAMEVAIGASLGGARSLVVLKSVGLNVALDPLATMTYTGCHRGLVILLGDDPGAWGSQNEQDTRWAARLAEAPLVEPTGVEDAAALMAQAFAWSEAIGTPVIVRITRSLALARGVPEPPWALPPAPSAFYRKRNRWITLPYLAVRRRHTLHARLHAIAEQFEASPYDHASGAGDLGVLAVGPAYAKAAPLLEGREGLHVLGLSSVWPLPEGRVAQWLAGLRRVLVVEEGGPFVEEGLSALAQRKGIPVTVLGRGTRAIPAEGELTPATIARALAALAPDAGFSAPEQASPAMPAETPLCADCPYVPTFEALLDAMDRHGGRNRYIVVGETGCMVRANLEPMELFDVKYSLGSGLGVGMGLAMSNPAHRTVAILGDSSFFHSDLNALPSAAQRDLPLLVLILDNGTTALTGGQTHPGAQYDARGRGQRAAALEDVLRGLGASPVVCTPEDRETLRSALEAGLESSGMQVVIARAPCPR